MYGKQKMDEILCKKVLFSVSWAISGMITTGQPINIKYWSENSYKTVIIGYDIY